jgi:uncharacterized membrane-anchored protein YhcB (DUF1043 family)
MLKFGIGLLIGLFVGILTVALLKQSALAELAAAEAAAKAAWVRVMDDLRKVRAEFEAFRALVKKEVARGVQISDEIKKYL